MIVCVLGFSECVKIDIFYKESWVGDWFLFCLDGLMDFVIDEEICGLVANVKDPE